MSLDISDSITERNLGLIETIKAVLAARKRAYDVPFE